MSTTTTPNMGMVLPVPSSEPGPAWATELVTALTTPVDGHDHSTGKGVKITQAGINLTGDLPLNTNNLTTVKTVVLTSNGATGSTSRELGAVGASDDLQYTDNSANTIQLTKNGSVNVPSAQVSTRSANITLTTQSGISGVVTLTNSSGGVFTITLPPAAGNGGIPYYFKDGSLSAGTNAVTVQRAGTDTIIDTTSVTSKALNSNGGHFVLVSDGSTKWYVIG